MKFGKRLALLAAATLTTSSMLAACGGNNGTDTAGAAADAKSQKPLEISIMSMYYTPEPPGPDNVVVKEVEKRTNTKLKITWVSPNNYADKVNVTLASGDIPDLMLLDNPFTSQVRQMVKQGAFWDLTPFIKDYPNLSKYPAETWTNTKQADGKNYGVPRVRPVEGGGTLYIRKDWLDNLKLEVPKTMDDLYKVLKAFTYNDPDGNGKNDTIGNASYVNANDMGNFYWAQEAFNQANGGWKLADGKLVNVNLLPGTREALVWLNNAYKEKIIPEDFAVLKQSQSKDMMNSGRAGSFADTVEAAWEPTENQRKVNPKADFLPLTELNGYNKKDSGFFGMFAIPKKVPEQKMKALLKFLDYGASDEGHELAWYGIEGTHFTKKDGVYTVLEQAKKDIVAQQAFGQIFGKYDMYQRAYRSGMDPATLERNKKIIDTRAKTSTPDYATGLYSETAVLKGPELDKKIQDLKTKVILGKEPITAWDDFATKLKTDPDMVKMTQEINDSYAKRVTGK